MNFNKRLFSSIRSNTVSVWCSVRNKSFYQKRSAGPKDLNRDDEWKCDTWTKLQLNRIAASNAYQLPGSTKSDPSQPQPAASQNKLKICQWNPECICPNFWNSPIYLPTMTLMFWLSRSQSYKNLTRLHLLKATPKYKKIAITSFEVESYFLRKQTSSLRNYIPSRKLAWRSSLFVYKQLNELGSNSLKYIYLLILLIKTRFILYSSSQHQLRLSLATLIDTQLWDPLQHLDYQGNEILDRILNNSLHILNDGSATWTSCIAGNDSAPWHLPQWQKLISKDILWSSRTYW